LIDGERPPSKVPVCSSFSPSKIRMSVVTRATEGWVGQRAGSVRANVLLPTPTLPAIKSAAEIAALGRRRLPD